mmetsp:Transcript_70012/g.193841  ORF Transcript_70012/g.193841 Transcript_70012/m.193841 type:complete len:233 (+) Transcript_70012:192-890(+)
MPSAISAGSEHRRREHERLGHGRVGWPRGDNSTEGGLQQARSHDVRPPLDLPIQALAPTEPEATKHDGRYREESFHDDQQLQLRHHDGDHLRLSMELLHELRPDLADLERVVRLWRRHELQQLLRRGRQPVDRRAEGLPPPSRHDAEAPIRRGGPSAQLRRLGVGGALGVGAAGALEPGLGAVRGVGEVLGEVPGVGLVPDAAGEAVHLLRLAPELQALLRVAMRHVLRHRL